MTQVLTKKSDILIFNFSKDQKRWYKFDLVKEQEETGMKGFVAMPNNFLPAHTQTPTHVSSFFSSSFSSSFIFFYHRLSWSSVPQIASSSQTSNLCAKWELPNLLKPSTPARGCCLPARLPSFPRGGALLTHISALSFLTRAFMDRIAVSRFSFRRKGSFRKDKERDKETDASAADFDYSRLSYLR